MTKDTGAFPKDGSKHDGFDNCCRACRALWRKNNHSNEKLRQLRHSIKWQSVSAVEQKKIKGVVRKLAYRWKVEHWHEDLYQWVLLSRLRWKPTEKQTTFPIDKKTIDAVRKIFGDSGKDRRKDPNARRRIFEHELTHALPLQAADDFFKMQSPEEPSDFVEDSINIIRKHFKGIKGYVIKAAIFELKMKHGFNQAEIARLLCVSETQVCFDIEYCMNILREKLGKELAD